MVASLLFPHSGSPRRLLRVGTTVVGLVCGLLSACVAGRSVGGTGGPDALACRADDGTCEAVNLSLEQVRGNIGGDCGTPDMIASDRVEAIGAAAVPYLVRAIGDRDEPVATFACRHAVRYGITDALRSACQSSRATKCCGGLDAEAAKQAMLPKILVGGWQDGCKPGTPRLEIDDVASGVARWCQGANDGAVDECTPVDALVVEGSILAVTVRDETRRFDAYEVVFADGKTPPQWVLWAVASSGCNWLRAANHGGRP